jgi:hypothetical protein
LVIDVSRPNVLHLRSKGPFLSAGWFFRSKLPGTIARISLLLSGTLCRLLFAGVRKWRTTVRSRSRRVTPLPDSKRFRVISQRIAETWIS